MFRLASILFSMVATSLAGAAVVVVLTMGYTGWQPIVAAAVIGLVLAFPVSWFVSKQIRENIR